MLRRPRSRPDPPPPTMWVPIVRRTPMRAQLSTPTDPQPVTEQPTTNVPLREWSFEPPPLEPEATPETLFVGAHSTPEPRTPNPPRAGARPADRTADDEGAASRLDGRADT